MRVIVGVQLVIGLILTICGGVESKWGKAMSFLLANVLIVVFAVVLTVGLLVDWTRFRRGRS